MLHTHKTYIHTYKHKHAYVTHSFPKLVSQTLHYNAVLTLRPLNSLGLKLVDNKMSSVTITIARHWRVWRRCIQIICGQIDQRVIGRAILTGTLVVTPAILLHLIQCHFIVIIIIILKLNSRKHSSHKVLSIHLHQQCRLISMLVTNKAKHTDTHTRTSAHILWHTSCKLLP